MVYAPVPYILGEVQCPHCDEHVIPQVYVTYTNGRDMKLVPSIGGTLLVEAEEPEWECNYETAVQCPHCDASLEFLVCMDVGGVEKLFWWNAEYRDSYQVNEPSGDVEYIPIDTGDGDIIVP